MKGLVKYIIFLFLFLAASFLVLGGIVYYKYIKTYNFYSANKNVAKSTSGQKTYCFSNIHKKLDINAYIQKQNLIASVAQKHVSLTVPYDYVLSYVLQRLDTFNYSNVGLPTFIGNLLDKLAFVYSNIFKIFKPAFTKDIKIPVVCIKVIDKGNAKLFLAKNWWAFAETNININNNKVKIKMLKVDSFDMARDLVNLINSKISDNLNIVPGGVNVYLDKDGLVLNYKIQSLIIKTN